MYTHTHLTDTDIHTYLWADKQTDREIFVKAFANGEPRSNSIFNPSYILGRLFLNPSACHGD